MDKLEEIRNELAGNTSFDEEHEEDLFQAILTMEEAEQNDELVQGLTKGDYILTLLFIIILGLVPVAYYAISLH